MVIFLTAIVEGELTKSIHPKQKKAMKTESMSNVPFNFLALSRVLVTFTRLVPGPSDRSCSPDRKIGRAKQILRWQDL
jgi:hypothetical protein